MQQLIHHPKENRFELTIDGYSSEVNYQWLEEQKVMSLNRVFVPNQLRGKGVASQLTQAVLEFVKEQQWKVVPVCPFVVTYIKRHPEWQEWVEQSKI